MRSTIITMDTVGLAFIKPKFWGQKSTFSPLAANLSPTDQCFQHEKGVSLESRYEGTKIGFWAQKRPNLAQTGILGQISAFLAHLI